MRVKILLIYLSTICITSYSSTKNQSSEPRKMFHYEQSVIIDKPISAVWKYMDNLDNCKDYLFLLKSVSKDPEGPNKIGTEVTYLFGFLFKYYTNYYKVTDYDPFFIIGFESMDGSDIKSNGTVIMNAIDYSSTKLTIKYNPIISGFFSNLSDETVDKIYNKSLTRILKKVKSNIE